MQTIVLIVIAVVALVVIIFYFYSGFASGKSGTSTMLNISSNKTAESCGVALGFGGCPEDKPYCCNGKCVENCDNCGGDANGDKVCGD